MLASLQGCPPASAPFTQCFDPSPQMQCPPDGANGYTVLRTPGWTLGGFRNVLTAGQKPTLKLILEGTSARDCC